MAQLPEGWQGVRAYKVHIYLHQVLNISVVKVLDIYDASDDVDLNLVSDPDESHGRTASELNQLMAQPFLIHEKNHALTAVCLLFSLQLSILHRLIITP